MRQGFVFVSTSMSQTQPKRFAPTAAQAAGARGVRTSSCGSDRKDGELTHHPGTTPGSERGSSA